MNHLNPVFISEGKQLTLNPLYTELTLPHYILEESNFNFRYVLLWDIHIPREKWLNYLQTVETLIRCRVLRRLINAASDLGLHCLPFTPLRVSRLQWFKAQSKICSRWHFLKKIFFFGNKPWNFMWIVCLAEDHMKCQDLFSKKTKNKKQELS